MLNLGSVPEEGPKGEGEGEGDEEELEEVIEAVKQNKRMLAERNASLQNKVHQVSHYTALQQLLFRRGAVERGGRGCVSPQSQTQYVLLSSLNYPTLLFCARALGMTPNSLFPFHCVLWIVASCKSPADILARLML